MKKRTGLLALMVCALALLLCVPADVYALTKPSDAERQRVQTMIDIGNRSAEGWRYAKKKEAQARERGDNEMAKRWRDLANDWADLYFDTRRQAVKWVDDYWNIPKPPNTTIFFDPNSVGKFGWCGGTKTDIKVGICPADFIDGPDLIASTKIHELKHAWQIHNCMSSNPGYWKDCTYWGHYSEWEAYRASEQAHDEGIIRLDKEQKERITGRIKEHRDGADSAKDKPTTTAGAAEKKESAGTEVEIPFTVHNPTGTSLEIPILIENDQGWPMFPPAYPPMSLGPEEEFSAVLMLAIPPGTPPGTVSVLSISGDASTIPTTVFVAVVPSVLVTGGPDVMGLSGETLAVEFTVENRGSVDDTFLLELSNPLGWPMALTSPALEQITLSAGEEAVIEAEMTIADDPTTHTTNLAFLTAVAQGDPTMTDTHWLSVTMAVENIAMLGIVEPTGFTTVTDSVSPKVVVQNLGHVDSFFDVFFEVELPGGGILTDGSVPVTAMIPGEAREIDLGAVVFTEGGNHTLRATVQLATDVDPLDDEDTLEFPVEVTTGVQDWRNL